MFATDTPPALPRTLTPGASSRETRPTHWLPLLRGGLGRGLFYVLHSFFKLVLGEAVKRIPDEIRSQHPQIPTESGGAYARCVSA